MDDESPYGRASPNGRSPRPPTMIERHMANRNQFNDVPPMPSLQQYNNLAAGGYGSAYNFPGSLQPSFSPGQIMPTSPPPTATGAQFFAPNGQAPSPYDSQYNEQSQLARQPSNAAAIYDQYGQPISQPSDALQGDQSAVGGNAHYVDLTRSSVTPFQAAQYAEISRKLNESPAALHAVSELEEEPASRASDHTLYLNQAAMGQPHLADGPAANYGSPFEDPQPPPEVHHSLRPGPFRNAAEEMPPGSPIYSLHAQGTSNERVLSNPPALPELQVPDAAFSPTSYDFPPTPKGMPTPSQATGEKFSKDLAPKAGKVAPQPSSQRPTSTYTVYDEADAYGGI